MSKKTEMECTIIRSDADLQALTERIKREFSFDYRTVSEARKTVSAGIYTLTFDATTLIPYRFNLNYRELRRMEDTLLPFFKEMKDHNRETYKELRERWTLLFFLLCAPKQYCHCMIEKATRPDFILTGEKRIGVEITKETLI